MGALAGYGRFGWGFGCKEPLQAHLGAAAEAHRHQLPIPRRPGLLRAAREQRGGAVRGWSGGSGEWGERRLVRFVGVQRIGVRGEGVELS